ncbi:hypothetical protein DN824_08635 [Stutzerimonas nosocomialis]|uniref:Uncharacterized protein n=1 Tax=Stutzerimonas nosocomialis TaxID=1056496 RepID=A0A5R9QBD4_9GAMM|nr:hypothetical protein [Stutzerimonas nosocomialis]TLX57650.1 hypothetical protein DN826_07155 [Stutzerimonas nosocomialis]TLX59161.1 hypothetical protein DN824_08635 [Stutzerimonas nosocomialis]TLX62449.1 hypothetical protein DN820_15885 [Stutzerimonas nosocomialis]
MSQSERGRENADIMQPKTGQGGSAGSSNGERAGGDDRDVPGGAYNVPEEIAEDVSEDEAQQRR